MWSAWKWDGCIPFEVTIRLHDVGRALTADWLRVPVRGCSLLVSAGEMWGSFGREGLEPGRNTRARKIVLILRSRIRRHKSEAVSEDRWKVLHANGG